MKVVLTKPLKIDEKTMDNLDLQNLGNLSGADVLNIDSQLRKEGTGGISDLYDQRVLIRFASHAADINEFDLQRLSAKDFLEVTFTVRNFFMGLLAEKTSEKPSEESTNN